MTVDTRFANDLPTNEGSDFPRLRSIANTAASAFSSRMLLNGNKWVGFLHSKHLIEEKLT